jgi:myo-inositol 2-dehydrogenase/D-chiro-inositol 1-dehydrogenase
MEKIKLGIIGLGRIGKIHLENINARFPHAKVMAIADPLYNGNRNGMNGQYDYVSNEELLNRPDIDAVLICTPTDTHAELIEKAAKAGKHIYCEKPQDLSLERAIRTLSIVKEAGVKFMLGFNRRFDPNFLKIKKLIDDGKIGEPHILKITSRDPELPSMEYLKSSGGLFMDMAIHDFDMARYLMKAEVVEVFARGNVLINPAVREVGDIDTAITTLTFSDGSMAVIDNSRQAAYGYDQRVEVFGSKGMAKAENNKADNHEYANAEGVHSALPLYFFLERYTASYLYEIEMFLESIKSGGKIPVSGQDGIMAMAMAVAADRSLKENRPVALAEILEMVPSV